MPIFLLIRHGETDYNKKMLFPGRLPDIHLNQRGRSQAELLAEKLKAVPINAIYSSPLDRTMETAEPLAKALNLDIISTPGLLETDCGDWQGQSVKKLRRQKIWQSVQQHPSLFHFPGGESIAECQHRMVQVLETLRLQHSTQELIACFSHSDPIKQVITYYLGLPLDNFQRLNINTGSVTVLQISENGSRLLMMNADPSFSWDSWKPSNSPVTSPPSKHLGIT
jgi:probable phosphomutase (TIGR03848 family)